MSTVRIKCPSCSASLNVKFDKKEDMIIECPVCKKKMKMHFSSTDNAAPSNPDSHRDKPVDETQYGDRTAFNSLGGTSGSSCSLVLEGREYPLHEGENIIGRDASSSSADVRLSTGDNYMSRMHAVISVSNSPSGALRASLRNFKNKNATYFNGTQLQDDEEVFLRNGDTIKMGKTTVRYKVTNK